MKVRDLKAILALMGDDCEVLIPASEHSYEGIDRADDATVGFDGEMYFEWYGSDNAGEKERPLRALVLT